MRTNGEKLRNIYTFDLRTAQALTEHPEAGEKVYRLAYGTHRMDTAENLLGFV